MVQKTDEQALFDAFFAESIAEGFDTYDHLPDAKAKYPFVIIGDTQNVFGGVKGRQHQVIIHIDVWGTPAQRKRVSDIIGTLFYFAARFGQSSGWTYRLLPSLTGKQVLFDTAIQNNPFWRGELDLQFTVN